MQISRKNQPESRLEFRGTLSQSNAVEPCDVGLINGVDWHAVDVGFVGQTN